VRISFFERTFCHCEPSGTRRGNLGWADMPAVSFRTHARNLCEIISIVLSRVETPTSHAKHAPRSDKGRTLLFVILRSVLGTRRENLVFLSVRFVIASRVERGVAISVGDDMPAVSFRTHVRNLCEIISIVLSRVETPTSRAKHAPRSDRKSIVSCHSEERHIETWESRL